MCMLIENKIKELRKGPTLKKSIFIVSKLCVSSKLLTSLCGCKDHQASPHKLSITKYSYNLLKASLNMSQVHRRKVKSAPSISVKKDCQNFFREKSTTLLTSAL